MNISLYAVILLVYHREIVAYERRRMSGKRQPEICLHSQPKKSRLTYFSNQTNRKETNHCNTLGIRQSSVVPVLV